MATELPWGVRRGIVAMYRYQPPANRYPQFRNQSRRVAAQLSRLDPRVWELPIEWRVEATVLHACAAQKPVHRKLSEEKTHHAKIANSLRKTANLLRTEGQCDPVLIGFIDVISRHYSDKLHSFRELRAFGHEEARLSDFLRAAADSFEGEKVRIYGIHRTGPESDRTGVAGAAIRAAAALREFFLSKTGRPHNELMQGIVAAYFPEVEERDWASTLDKRNPGAKRNRKSAGK